MRTDSLPIRRGLILLACAGAALSRGWAQEAELPAGMGSLLGLSSTRLLEIEERYRAADSSGDWQRGMTELAELARTARESGDHSAWIGAELAWVKLASHESDEEDLADALQELVDRAREWGLSRQEAEIFTYWAGLLEGQGEWLMALRAHDGAAQVTLGDGMVNRALQSLLEMSRLCRENEHPWRLQQVWLRIGQVESSAVLDKSTRAQLEAERALAEPLMAPLVPLTAAAAHVDLQPAASAVKVSATHAEVGRARFLLTNESTATVRGTLKAEAKTGTVKKWESGSSGQWITVGPANTKTPATPARRDLSLRPGERLSVYVEREMPGTQDTVNLTWSGPAGDAAAKAEYLFAAGEPLSSITSAGSFTLRPGWSVPFYHEINHRGPGVRVEDFQFEASVPCRLEILDVDGGSHPSVDAGRLLAVDADGDGVFTGPDDVLVSDINADKSPDLLIADRSRSLEIFAWPLVPVAPGESITLTARLRRPEEPGAWRTDAENSLSAPAAKKSR